MPGDLPTDVADAIKSAGLDNFFAGCTRAHKNEYLKWIGEAKRPETRRARIAKSMELLSARRAEEDRRAKKVRGPKRTARF
jgi:uncharacterized protein YdeI (YjbR/CyaY-like superfamily)